MTSLTVIRTPFEYNHWALKRILVAASRLDPSSVTAETAMPHRSLWSTLFHAYGAESLWIERCRGHSPSAFPEGEDHVGTGHLQEKWAQQYHVSMCLLAYLDDVSLSREAGYRTLGGLDRTDLPSQILVHVAAHTMQHRPEAAQILTQSGQSPGDLDFDEYVEAKRR